MINFFLSKESAKTETKRCPCIITSNNAENAALLHDDCNVKAFEQRVRDIGEQEHVRKVKIPMRYERSYRQLKIQQNAIIVTATVGYVLRALSRV